MRRPGDAVCGLHRARGDEQRGFLICASKARLNGFLGSTSKPRSTVSRFGPQNRQLQFGDLSLKITVTVSWFGPQNQANFGLLVAPQKQQRDVSLGHPSGSSDLLHL
jgi:hypothetical protein